MFYISLASLLAILVLPLTKVPSLETFVISSGSTIFWTLGIYFMFKALKIGQISRIIPIIGTLIPLILLVEAYGTNGISTSQTYAVLILILGMVFLTLTDWQGKFTKKEVIFEIISAFSFALSYVLLKQAYLKFDPLSVVVWSRLILLPLGILIISIPNFRRKIISSHGPKINFFSKVGLVFLLGQVSGTISEMLLLFSISLANPVLVN